MDLLYLVPPVPVARLLPAASPAWPPGLLSPPMRDFFLSASLRLFRTCGRHVTKITSHALPRCSRSLQCSQLQGVAWCSTSPLAATGRQPHHFLWLQLSTQIIMCCWMHARLSCTLMCLLQPIVRYAATYCPLCCNLLSVMLQPVVCYAATCCPLCSKACLPHTTVAALHITVTLTVASQAVICTRTLSVCTGLYTAAHAD